MINEKQDFISDFNKTYPELLNTNGSHKLNDRWVMWSHDHDKGWKLSDYTKHCVITTVEEFWNIYNGLPSLNNKDMWFLMRDGIPPLWEDPINLEGGSFKFRIDGNSVDNTWLTLSIHLVTENMCLGATDAGNISGIGLSPKQKNFCTVSVWNLDSKSTEHAQFPKNIADTDFRMSRYETHKGRSFGR